MKSRNTFLLHCVLVIAAFLAQPGERAAAKAAAGADQSGDPGWPRERYQDGTRLIGGGAGADDDN